MKKDLLTSKCGHLCFFPLNTQECTYSGQNWRKWANFSPKLRVIWLKMCWNNPVLATRFEIPVDDFLWCTTLWEQYHKRIFKMEYNSSLGKAVKRAKNISNTLYSHQIDRPLIAKTLCTPWFGHSDLDDNLI